MFVLIFAAVAAQRLTTEWDMTYSQLIPYITLKNQEKQTL